MEVRLTHNENLILKKLREVRETNGLELDPEGAEPTIGRNFETKFEIPNEYSDNILITDSGFILSGKTSAICITADMSFNTRLKPDFKIENKYVDFFSGRDQGWGEWQHSLLQFHKFPVNTCAFGNESQ